MNFAGDENPRVIPLRIQQFGRPLEGINISFPSRRRLVCDDGLHVQWKRGSVNSSADNELGEDVEETVRLPRSGEGWQIQYARSVIYLLLDPSQTRAAWIEADLNRAQGNAVSRQIQLRHLRRHLVEFVPVGIRSESVRRNANQDGAGSLQAYGFDLPIRKDDVDIGVCTREEIPLFYWIRRMHLAGQFDTRRISLFVTVHASG